MFSKIFFVCLLMIFNPAQVFAIDWEKVNAERYQFLMSAPKEIPEPQDFNNRCRGFVVINGMIADDFSIIRKQERDPSYNHFIYHSWDLWPLQNTEFTFKAFYQYEREQSPNNLAHLILKRDDKILYDGELTFPITIQLEPTHWYPVWMPVIRRIKEGYATDSIPNLFFTPYYERPMSIIIQDCRAP